MAGQHAATFARTISKRVSGQYLVSLPKGYEAGSGERWPVILFLHGSGERGDDLEQVKAHGPARLVEEGQELPFIVVSPQCPRGEWWTVDLLNALVDEVLEQYDADPDRVCLTGLSMGGFGTFALGLRHAERFAAIAPICGGGDPVWVRPEHARLPVWVFHGAEDDVVRPAESERMVDALRAVGNEVRFTLYPDAKHDSWTESYANPALYAWFLEQRRGAQ